MLPRLAPNCKAATKSWLKQEGTCTTWKQQGESCTIGAGTSRAQQQGVFISSTGDKGNYGILDEFKDP